jgi:predicted small lipoprotein YifL
MKKVLALVLALVMLLSLTACAKPAEPAAAPATTDAAATAAPEAAKYKIAIYTNTVSQNEEEFRSGEIAVKKYGADKIVTQTMPDNFMKEQEVLISNGLALVSDPDVKALIMNQAVPGAAAMFEKVREERPDVLLVAITPAETDVIGAKADIVLQPDELSMGYTIPAQAQKLGAKTFVHYSFPRHMSYPLLAQRRDIFKTECEKLGMKFVDATAPDPTGDAGIPGAQQFILEDVPRKVAEFGKDTNFFSTNCAMQEPLIKAALENGAIDAQQCCPSPYHGYPGALGLQIPEDKAGDVTYLIEQIKAKIAEKGGTGRFSTWPVPFSMMSTAAAVDYAVQYAEGKITSKNDQKALEECYKTASGGYEIKFATYDNQANFYLMLCDYITF